MKIKTTTWLSCRQHTVQVAFLLILLFGMTVVVIPFGSRADVTGQEKNHTESGPNSLIGRMFFIGRGMTQGQVIGSPATRQIYTIDVNGSKFIQLVPDYSSVWDLIWYPEQQELGFRNIADQANLNGWFSLNLKGLSALKGENLNQRIKRTLPSAVENKFVSQEIIRGSQRPDYSTRATLSPDGEQVAGIVSNGSDPLHGSRICVANTNGKGKLRCIDNVRACSSHSPVWSPDGNWVVFAGATKTDRFACNLFELYIADRNGSQARQLTNIEGPKLTKAMQDSIVAVGTSDEYWHKTGHPAWSPDGNWIAFDSPQGIGRVHPDGTDLEIITKEGHSPAWSPDGRFIAFIVPRRDEAATRVSHWPYYGVTKILIITLKGQIVKEVGSDKNYFMEYHDLIWAP